MSCRLPLAIFDESSDTLDDVAFSQIEQPLPLFRMRTNGEFRVLTHRSPLYVALRTVNYTTSSMLPGLYHAILILTNNSYSFGLEFQAANGRPEVITGFSLQRKAEGIVRQWFIVRTKSGQARPGLGIVQTHSHVVDLAIVYRRKGMDVLDNLIERPDRGRIMAADRRSICLSAHKAVRSAQMDKHGVVSWNSSSCLPIKNEAGGGLRPLWGKSG